MNPFFQRFGIGIFVSSLAIPALAARAASPDAETLGALAASAVSGSADAVVALRQKGYAGLDAVLGAGARTAPRICWSSDASGRASQGWCAAVDAVAGQRDASASRLYWHTDLEAAKREATATGKPILSLRLLGRLDQELSCANSRFFRVALYANRKIAEELRNSFVLHWESVRPVPRITVDFGDGRALQSTITGNSVHYVLDAQGRPLDALPGLYGPQAFLRWLGASRGLADELRDHPEETRAVLSRHHEQQRRAAEERWSRVPSALRDATLSAPNPPTAAAVAAPVAMSRAYCKASVETPLMAAFLRHDGDPPADPGLAAWREIASRYAHEARLDAASRALFDRDVRSPQALANFETSMALDTVRNETLLHSRIHEWFESPAGVSNLARFNEKVYAELFLTPSSDPWLGLLPPDRYSALSDGGVRMPLREIPARFTLRGMGDLSGEKGSPRD